MKNRVAIIAVLASILGVTIIFTVRLAQNIDLLELEVAIKEQQVEMYNNRLERYSEKLSQLEEQLIQNDRLVSSLHEESDSLRIEVANLEKDAENWRNQADHWMTLYTRAKNVGTLKHFSSPAELQQWLWNDPTSDNNYSYRYDCDDFAIDLLIAAQVDGYLVGLYFEEDHLVNFATIGNTVYIIEPQTDEFWTWGYID